MLFTVALFVWDDTIDTNEHMLASDFQRAELWREQSLCYFKYHLRLSPQGLEPYCPDDICLLFKEFAERFCDKFGEGVYLLIFYPQDEVAVFPYKQARGLG